MNAGVSDAGTPPPPPVPPAFSCSMSNPEASGFAKQLACPGVDLDSWWSVRLPMQMFFKYEDHWEELNGDGTLQQKVFTTTLSLHMCSHGTTDAGVNWHGRGSHRVWQWLVPEQCLQVRFHHSACDDRSVVHSFQREVAAPSYSGEPQRNRFMCHRGCRGKYSKWMTTLELWKSSFLIQAKGWKPVPTEEHPLFSCPLHARRTLHLFDEQSMLCSLNTNSIVGA